MSCLPDQESHLNENFLTSLVLDPHREPSRTKTKSRAKAQGKRIEGSTPDKNVNMVNQFPQYIGRTGLGIIVMIKDSYGFLKYAIPSLSVFLIILCAGAFLVVAIRTDSACHRA